MKKTEFYQILAAIIVMSAVSGFYFGLNLEWTLLTQACIFSIIIISLNIFAKKTTANLLDADVEHEILLWQRFGLRPKSKLRKPIPIGIFLPLIITVFSLGIVKFLTFLTYETTALKRRAAKRFGFYSYKEMTDWHNGLIGASGIVALFILAIIAYILPFSGFEYLAKLSIYYTFFNLIPLFKLDGTQIFFGSRILWTTLAIISTLLTALALITP